MTTALILAGDLGGTHTRLRLTRIADGGREVLRERHYPSEGYDGLLPILQTFLADAGGLHPDHACLAVAGPVHHGPDGDRARVTRLQWELDGADLRRALGVKQLRLINDFEAIGHAIDAVPADQLHRLQEGEAAPGALRALIGAGTGLGQALLIPDGGHWRVQPTEGGHAELAPQNPRQAELLHHLWARFPHVSYDRVVSGPGLVLIYRFLCEHRRQPPSLDPDAGDAAARISEAARSGSDAAAVEAVETWIDLYGAQAGNLALTAMALGGVYIAGGIAPRLLDLLDRGGFMAAFHRKGRMASLMRRFPVQVVLTEQPGLLGAERAALA